MAGRIPIIQSLVLLQQQLNRIISELEAAQSEVGTTLPVVAEPEGKLFYQQSDSTLYQAQGGSWVAL